MPSDSVDTELTLTDYLAILRRRWLWVVSSIVILLALALGMSVNDVDRYRSQAAVLLSSSAAQDALGEGINSTSVRARQIENEINVARSDRIREEVGNRLGFVPGVAVNGTPGTDILTFTATATDPDAAAEAANVWADVYVDVKRDLASSSIEEAVTEFATDLAALQAERAELRAPIQQAQDALAAANDLNRARLEAELVQLEGELSSELNLLDSRIEAVSSGIVDLELSGQVARLGTAQIVQVAAPPSTPINSPLSRNLILAFVVGSILGLAAALIAENLDRTIKDATDVAKVTTLPVLGSIPEATKADLRGELSLIAHDDPDHRIADAYHKVRTSLQFSFIDGSVTSILITSPNQNEGKTTTSVNLALTLTSIGRMVTLADVDFRRPRIHRVFGAELEPGLSNHLLDGTALVDLALQIRQDEASLVVLPSGTLPPNPARFVSTPPFARLVDALELEADLVILDAPPTLPVSDAVALGALADAVVIVVRSGSTTTGDLARTLESFDRVGASVLGIVIVGHSENVSGYSYSSATEARPTNRRASRIARRIGDENGAAKHVRDTPHRQQVAAPADD